MAVLIETSLGDITVDLFTKERPRSALNFLKLCKIKYYNFSLFHSVQRNLVAQTGDPTGTGRGGQSVFAHLYGDQAVYFDMETVPRIKHRQKGLVSMVNNGSNGHASQFFFTLAEDLDYLDGVHTVIGEVAEGLDVLDKINEAYCDEQHRPYKDIRIYHTIVLDDPYPDPDELVVPDRSPEPTKEQLDSGRIGVDEDIDDNKGLTEAEVQESMEKKEAQANAQILEMVGDLPDVDVKPPDTVLFVCKLNPVTTSEDLEIIFSRFGTIKSCEVIKDQKSEESLQYAFIEFEKPDDCEAAYFKMDNVLIDDRRIHVDFSQSVSKLQFNDRKDEDNDGMFGPKYQIKDSSKKDNKYDLVFEAGSGGQSQRTRDKDMLMWDDKKRHRSRSRSSDRSPIKRNKERKGSRSPVRKERNTEQRKKSKKSRHQSSEDERDRKEFRGREPGQKKVKQKKRRGSSSDSSSDSDANKNGKKEKSKSSISTKSKDAPRTSSDSDVERDSEKYRKSKNIEKTARTVSGSDDSSQERRRKKKKKQRHESDDQSDERSKGRSKSGKSRHNKPKHNDSDSDPDHKKSRKRRADSRERSRDVKSHMKDRDKGRSRESEERSYKSRDDDRYKERKEKKHKERR